MLPCVTNGLRRIEYNAIIIAGEQPMVITLGPDIEAALNQQASLHGVAPEALALSVLRQRFVDSKTLPRDEWERRLLSAASDCGVSLSNEAVSSEGLYH
jgi:hypothetical protein